VSSSNLPSGSTETPGRAARLILRVCVVTLAYWLSFALVIWVILPLQRMLLPQLPDFTCVLFLPHGVRVLTAWLFGWTSILMLIPGSLTVMVWLYGGLGGLTLADLAAAFLGVACAAFSFWAMARLGHDYRVSRRGGAPKRPGGWRDVLLVGGLASVMNAFGGAVLFQHDVFNASARFVGDILGLFVAMYVLMLAFAVARRV
jgi:hypothetical protein